MKPYVLFFLGLILSIKVFSQFEEPKLENPDSLKVKIGGDFAMQYQAIKHHADSTLIPLGQGINLPTANLNIDGFLARGIKVNLVVYLSSRHHNDTWVKGGYLLLDQMPFLNSQVIDNIMNYLSIKIGVMEINYGDEHFRRSDNGNVLRNPFVGNYIMDAFTTAPALELMYRRSGLILMGGITSDNLDPSIAGYNASKQQYTAFNVYNQLAYYGKIGFDEQLGNSYRVRLTFSPFINTGNHSGTLYFGDRTGSRYYLVMNKETNSASDVDPSVNFTSGNWGPGFTNRDHSYMTNLYLKIKRCDFFGTYESAKGTTASGNIDFKFNQYAAEGLYHFGKQEQFYGGARYDYVKDKDSDMWINRAQFSLGWFLTKNITAKAEYVNQKFNHFATYGSDAGFKGIVVEAGISF